MKLVAIELGTFWSALVAYSLATAIAMWALVFRRRPERTLLALMSVGLLLHTVAIGARWMRVGHLPVGNMFEMLSANVWGLMAAVVVGYALLPRVRAFAAVVLPVVMMVLGWMLLPPMEVTSLPPTYDTVWLYIHIAFIKLFLGAALIALGIAGIILLRGSGVAGDRFSTLPADAALDDTAYRCMALALIFDTLGVVSGAIWAQDAWGRYWSWDPLEVWSLVTWLCIGLTLHLRASFHTRPRTNSILIVVTFVVAFFTFFGIPFVSRALHKGAI